MFFIFFTTCENLAIILWEYNVYSKINVNKNNLLYYTNRKEK
jgi:hypothetical protein